MEKDRKRFFANLVWLVLVVFFVFMGLRYTPAHMTDIFSSTGNLPHQFKLMIIIFDVAAFGIAVLLLILRSWFMRHADKFLLVVFSLVLSLIMVEFLARAYVFMAGSETMVRFLPESMIEMKPKRTRHHYLGYCLTPDYRSIDGENRHNSLGFRGEEFLLEKPEGEFRVALVGGSTTYSEAVKSWKESWSVFLETVLHGEYGLQNVKVINAGVGGYDSFQSLMNIEFRVLPLEPDLVIVHDGLNDAHTRFVDPAYYKSDNSGMRRPWEEDCDPFFMKFVSVRLAMTALTGQSFEPSIGFHYNSEHSAAGVVSPEYSSKLNGTPMEVLEKNQPIHFERNLVNMINVVRGNGSEIVFITWPYNTVFDDYMKAEHYRRAVDEHNDIMRKVALEHDVFLYDLAGEMPMDSELWKENRHLTSEGARVKAELTAAPLSRYVNEIMNR